VIAIVLEFLKVNKKLKTLAAAARVNHGIYDLAIPRLYETIEVTGDNQDWLAYGCSDYHKTLGKSECPIAPAHFTGS
jgi:hypothetical protein